LVRPASQADASCLGLVPPFDASRHVTQTARSWPRGTKEDLQHAICSRKRIDRIAGGYGTAPQGLGSDRRYLGGTRDAKRQIQLTAVYIKKLTAFCGISRHMSPGNSIQFNYQLCCRTAFRRANLDGANESAVHRLLHRRMTANNKCAGHREEHTSCSSADVRYNGTFEQDHIALAIDARPATSCRIIPQL